MKKTTLTLMTFGLLLCFAVSVQAQVSDEARQAKALLVEAQANLADIQERFPSSPDVAAFQEKVDYLEQLLEEFSVNGSTDATSLTRSDAKSASALYEEKVAVANGTRQAPAIQVPQTDNGSAMTAEQSAIWSLLQSTERKLADLQKDSSADAATIQAYQARVSQLKKLMAN